MALHLITPPCADLPINLSISKSGTMIPRKEVVCASLMVSTKPIEWGSMGIAWVGVQGSKPQEAHGS